MKNEVFLEYRETRSGGEMIDDWDHEDEHVEFHPVCLALTQSRDHWRNETISVDFKPQPGQDVDLIVVRYETGSTFGRIIGVWQIIGVYQSHKRALQIRDAIQDHNDDSNALKKVLGESFYPNWMGYFERFMDVELHCMRLRD